VFLLPNAEPEKRVSFRKSLRSRAACVAAELTRAARDYAVKARWAGLAQQMAFQYACLCINQDNPAEVRVGHRGWVGARIGGLFGGGFNVGVVCELRFESEEEETWIARWPVWN